MNTNSVNIMELSSGRTSSGKPFDEKLRSAAIQLEIANRAIKALSGGQRMRAGEIAAAINPAALNYQGNPADATAQQVGVIMRKLVAIGRVKLERVDGDPMEITVQPRGSYNIDTGTWEWPEPYQKTITPKISYYSLV